MYVTDLQKTAVNLNVNSQVYFIYKTQYPKFA